MKSKWKNLLSVLGVTVCTAAFTGCETDAEEAKEKQEGNSSPTPIVTNLIPATNAAAPVLTDANAAVALATPAPATELAGGTNGTVVKPIPPALPANLKLSPGVQEIVKLAQSGVSETVILLYVEKATEPFNLDAEDIVYLNDIGISSTVLAAMLNRDGASPELQNALTNTTQVATAPFDPTNSIAQAAPMPGQTPIPAPQYEVSSNYIATAPAPQDPNVQYVQPQPVVIQQPVVVQQPVMVEPSVTYSYFYSSLAPYGGWVYVTDYGWCWQPTIAVAHRGWRPYSHGGRWLNSDAGWYWHSDYSWGWAPFHYGRWHSSPRHGWVWTPDYTWGPSWVTWRRGADYCGWAPLPPRCDIRPGVGFTYWNRNVGFNFSFGLGYEHYTFVPTRHFAGRRVIDHVVPTEKTVNIYKDSTIVNNYIVGNNNTIINNGIGRDYVAAHTRTEIPKVAIRDEPRGGRVIPANRVEKAGNDLVVYRPTPPPARAEATLRQNQEIVRPSAAGPSISSGLASGASRPGSTVTPVEGRPGETRRGGSTASPRGEVARPTIATRTEVPTATFATPAPLRPEPERTVTTSTVRPNNIASRPASTGSSLISASPTGRPDNINPVARPNTAAVESRATFSQPNTGIGARPTVSAPTRTEVTRPPNAGAGVAISPNAAGSAPAASTAISRPTINPAVSQPATATVRPNYPARSPDLATPRTEARNNAASSVSVNPAARPIQSAPTVNPAVRPTTESSIPRLAPQPNVSVAPQPIRPSTPYQQTLPSTAVTSPRVSSPPVSRSEGFGASRPTVAPVQRAPISGGGSSGGFSAPSVNSSVSRGSPVPNVRSEAARPNLSPSAPSGGGRPAPAASAPAPAQNRPSAPSSGSRSEGRGRVEIGR